VVLSFKNFLLQNFSLRNSEKEGRVMKQAVILAGGKGSKIFPYNETRPKSTIPVCNQPLIRHTIKSLENLGIEEIIVVTGNLQDQVRYAVGENKKVKFFEQEKPTGTAHALRKIYDSLKEEFLVVYGDVLTPEENFKKLLDLFKKKKPIACALVDETKKEERGSWIYADIRDENLISIGGHSRSTGYRISGVFAFDKEKFEKYLYLNPGIVRKVSVGGMPPLEAELSQSLQIILEDGKEVPVAISEEFVVDIDKPWHILEANEKMLNYIFRNLKENKISPSSKISPDTIFQGKVVIGENCEIGPKVIFAGNVIVGNNTKILNGAIIYGNTIIGENCTIYNYCEIGANTAIGNRCKVGHTAEVSGVIMDGVYLVHYCEIWGVIGESTDIGAATVCGNLRFDDQYQTHLIKGRKEIPGEIGNAVFIGDYCRTGVNAILMPGVKIGAYSCVGPGVVLNQDIPSRTLVLVKQELLKKEWGPEIYGW
jgi:bifunctional UDP-N-acetylglucosamine pyrophosphorylase/glucosamine-1-phosphate N-acetyltransferase